MTKISININKYANKISKLKSQIQAAENTTEFNQKNIKNDKKTKEHFENVSRELSNIKSEVNSNIKELKAKLDGKQLQ